MTDWLMDQVFDFNGHQVRYAVRGDGPPLVFVHGTPFSSYNNSTPSRMPATSSKEDAPEAIVAALLRFL